MVTRLRALALAALVCCACSGPPTDDGIPGVDPESVEPQVASKIETARERVRREPRSADAWGALGQLLQAHDLQRRAASAYDRAMELAPEDYRWPYLAALARWRSDVVESIGFFERAAKLDSDNHALYVHFGTALLRAGEPSRAAAEFRNALSLNPRSSHARLGLARVALVHGDTAAALDELREAARIGPDQAELHLLLAQVHGRGGDEASAERERDAARRTPRYRAPDPVVEAMQAESVSSHAHSRRGRRLVAEGRLELAERELRRALEYRSSPQAHAQLGRVLALREKLDEAIEQLEAALRLAPEDLLILIDLGTALSDRGDLERAAELLTEAVRLDPTAAGAHFNLGRARFRQGSAARSIPHYEEALRLAPTEGEIHTRLGIALAAVDRTDEAVSHWRRALEFRPGDADALLALATVLAQRGNHAEAIRLAERSYGTEPGRGETSLLFAWLLATAPRSADRNGEKAIALLDGLGREHPRTADVLAAALAETGRFDEAVRAAEQGLRAAEEQGEAALAAAMRQRLQGYRNGRPHRE